MPKADVLVENAGEVVTPVGGSARGGDKQGRLRVLEDGAVALVDGAVAAVGSRRELSGWTGERVVDAGGGVVVPGLVDAHTHLVFAGDRSRELVLKLEGASYEEILEGGGGILSTVEATRDASFEKLVALARGRLDRCLAAGTTTLEAKSGYGLSVDEELRLLEVLEQVDTEHAVDVVSTVLGAHAVPDGVDRGAFVEDVAGPLTRRVAKRGLASFCDVFVDEGAFSVEEGRAVLQAGREVGLGVRVHADELACTRATRLGLEVGASSIDHVNRADEEDVRAWGDLGGEGPVATLCPVTPFTTKGVPYADAQALVEAGVPVALGSDMNPNAYSEGMWFAIALAVHGMRMQPSEALVAATVNSAASLGLEDRGRLEEGCLGDVVVLDIPSFEHVGYRVSGPPVRCVIKRGRVVHEAGRVAGA